MWKTVQSVAKLLSVNISKNTKWRIHEMFWRQGQSTRVSKICVYTQTSLTRLHVHQFIFILILSTVIDQSMCQTAVIDGVASSCGILWIYTRQLQHIHRVLIDISDWHNMRTSVYINAVHQHTKSVTPTCNNSQLHIRTVTRQSSRQKLRWSPHTVV